MNILQTINSISTHANRTFTTHLSGQKASILTKIKSSLEESANPSFLVQIQPPDEAIAFEPTKPILNQLICMQNPTIVCPIKLGIRDSWLELNLNLPLGDPKRPNLIYESPPSTAALIQDGLGSNENVVTNYQFNKLRNDTKHRKRAFAKRGCFRQSHAMLRKDNRLRYAYALQGIDYDLLSSLEIGEIPDLKSLKK